MNYPSQVNNEAEKENMVANNNKDKENFNSRNSLTNLMRTISKRHSKSEMVASEQQEQQKQNKYKTPLKEDGSNTLKPDSTGPPR